MADRLLNPPSQHQAGSCSPFVGEATLACLARHRLGFEERRGQRRKGPDTPDDRQAGNLSLMTIGVLG
jgi:hypothetical protein